MGYVHARQIVYRVHRHRRHSILHSSLLRLSSVSVSMNVLNGNLLGMLSSVMVMVVVMVTVIGSIYGSGPRFFSCPFKKADFDE